MSVHRVLKYLTRIEYKTTIQLLLLLFFFIVNFIPKIQLQLAIFPYT